MCISKFEKFCIRYRTVIEILLYAVLIFGISMSDNHPVKRALFAIGVAIDVFFSLVQSKPLQRANRLYNDDLDPKSAAELAEALLRLQSRSALYKKQDIYNGLFGYCISAGDTERVIDLYTEIKRKHKNIDKISDLQLRLFLCAAYLNRGEKYLYDREIDEIQNCLSDSKIKKRLLNDQFREVKLLEESLYGGNNPRFEEDVLDFLYERKPNSKIRNKKPSNMQTISAYGLLFNFYKRNGNSEKTAEYAIKIAEIGNEQLAVYRSAKEYLENADKSN